MGTLALKADERVASVEFSNDFLVVGRLDLMHILTRFSLR